MDNLMGIAGLLSVLLALGHATFGLVWVLPGIDDNNLPTTPFGGRKLTAATIHATWHIVTVFAFSSGVILLLLAWGAGSDVKTVVLRVFAAMWLSSAAVASWAGLRRTSRPRDAFRFPVPIFFVIVAVLCWMAST